MATTQIFGSGTILIGPAATHTDAFECQINNFTIGASSNSVTIPATYCEGPGVAAQPSTFAVTLAYAQDWGATTSLSELLFAQDGEILFYIFTPDYATVCSFAGEMYGVSGDIGGEGQGLWVTSQDLPCVAKPVHTPAV